MQSLSAAKSQGPASFLVEVDGLERSVILGLNIEADVDTFVEGIVQVRYLYSWCPTPGAGTTNSVDNG
ncbi:hypothetical protein SARC_17103, partial [Sphaeroforma arctica JP610]